MKIVIQRVKQAEVVVDGQTVGKIGQGYLLYVCFENEDTKETVSKAVDKILKMRINEDGEKKMNLNLSQVQGEILSISQFTLSWNGKSGHRPSFEGSMPPGPAKLLYHLFNQQLKQADIHVEQGIFGAEMLVSSINNGLVTFFLDF